MQNETVYITTSCEKEHGSSPDIVCITKTQEKAIELAEEDALFDYQLSCVDHEYFVCFAQIEKYNELSFVAYHSMTSNGILLHVRENIYQIEEMEVKE